jgi:hypothetical protein
MNKPLYGVLHATTPAEMVRSFATLCLRDNRIITRQQRAQTLWKKAQQGGDDDVVVQW